MTRNRPFAVLGCALLASCAPVEDPSAGLSVAETVALIERTPPSGVALDELVEAYAFGSPATEAERARLQHAVLGRVVEWELPLASVGYTEGKFVVATPPVPTANRAEAVPVLRVVAFVLPRDDDDRRALMALRGDEVLRVRGIVQEIRSGRNVAIVPAVIAGPTGPRPH